MSAEPSSGKRSSIDTLLAPRGATSNRRSSPSGGTSRGGGEGMDRKIEKKTWTPKRISMIAAGIAFLALIAWGISTTSGGRKLNVDRERVTVSEVTFEPFQEMSPGTGNVEPRTTVFLDAVEGGRIEEIFVLEGETVEEDQPILRLSNPTLQLQLLQTETQRIEQRNRLEDTRFQVDQANLRTQQDITDMDYNIRRLQRDHARNEALYERQLISQAEFERIRDEYEYWQRRRDLTIRAYRQDSLRQRIQIDQMESAVQRMDANFEIVNQRLENLTLRAPVSGQLSQLNAELGELKNAGFRFGQIDMLDGFKVRAGIDEFYISRVQRGQRAITNPIAGQEYEMVVRRVYPEVVNSRFEIDLDFVGDVPPTIRRGQTIRFRIEMSDPADAVVVPQGGFFQTTGGNWIYVLDESGDFAEKRPIRLGRKNPEVYEVLEGLQPGEQVVTSSYDTFNEADRLVFR
ncbi:MAG: HlyD family efflux transporter periplasmic adaptor subunit [Bacteroidota bacterium]|nr:HlyD family efflux transporter periplasmic adaptor subunit [Bacteroidota bacterium]